MIMQLIRTRFLPADDSRGERVRAYVSGPGGGQATLPYDYGLSALENHREVAQVLAVELGWPTGRPVESRHTTVRGYVFEAEDQS